MENQISFEQLTVSHDLEVRVVSPSRGLDVTGHVLHKNDNLAVLQHYVEVNGKQRRRAAIVLPQDTIYV